MTTGVITTAEIIRERFPGKVVLTVAEVAIVIGQHPDHVRDRLRNGSLVPGLQRDGGRWRVPVESLVEAIDRLTAPPGPAKVLPPSQLASTANPTRKQRPMKAHFEAMRRRAERDKGPPCAW